MFCSYFVTTFSEAPLVSNSGFRVLLHFFKSGFGSTFSEAPLVSKSGIDLAPPFPKVDKGG